MRQVNADAAGASLRLLLDRIGRILDLVGPRFPLFARDDGTWETTDDGNWCAGYWIGLLWLAAYHARSAPERDRFLDAARGLMPAMLSQRTDNLFAGLNHHHAGYLGFDLTGDETLKEIGLRGARAMLALYDPKARQIPIGDYATAPVFSSRFRGTMPLDRRTLAAVDAVHTSVPVLLRAHKETGEAAFRDVSADHVARHIAWHLRDDGSSVQMTAFDPATGAPVERFNPLAAGPDTCWARGLGWSIAGLADFHVHTGDAAALDALGRSVDFYLASVDDTLVPAWDFSLPAPPAVRDASAAAVTACGLIGLAARASAATAALEETGARILAGLVASCQVADRSRSDAGAILHGCYRHPEGTATDNELIWTDFYVALALHRLAGG